MNSSDAWWLKVWVVVAAVGFLIVIIGVVIEGVEHFVKFRRGEHARKLQLEKFGWFLVVAGLAMEFLGDHAAKRISDIESARLNNEAADARRDAGDAIKQASQANERASSNELARLELEQSISPRSFNNQLAAIRNLTRFSNQNVSIEFVADHEARRTAALIRFVLRNAGWNMTKEPVESSIPIFMVEGVRIEGRSASGAAETLGDELTKNNIATTSVVAGCMGTPRILVRVGFKPSLARTKVMFEETKMFQNIREIDLDSKITNRTEKVYQLIKAHLRLRGVATNNISDNSFMANGDDRISGSLMTNGSRGNNLLWE